MTFRMLWRDISSAGTRPSDPPDERRRVLIANQSAMIAIVSCVGFAVAFAIAGPAFYMLAIVNVGTVVLELLALFVTRRGARTLAKVMILLTVHVLIVVASLRLGVAAGFQAYFFVFAANSFLFFGEKQPWLRISFALLSVLCCLIVSFAADIADAVELSPIVTESLGFASAVVVVGTMVFIVDLFTSAAAQAEALFAEEHARSERLLLNVLPATISARLKDDDRAIADGFADVTVLFADLVGFTELSQRMTPAELVTMLNRVFSAFDDLAETLGLEKIKTIGDCYMVAAGIPDPRPDHVEAAARMALGIRVALAHINEEAGYGLRLRIGLHTGPLIAGVIGKRKFIYDLWGDTVNTASRMESSGAPDEIHISKEVHERLVGKFDMTPRGVIKVKGKGELETYFLGGEL